MILKTNDYTPTFIESAEGDGVTMFNDLVKLDRGNLICIAARPGMGKTSLVLHMALEYAKKCDKTVYIFSIDSCSGEIHERMLCSLAEIDIDHMRSRKLSAEDKNKIAEASALLKDMNIIIDDAAELTDRQMMERLDTVDNLGLVIVDDSLRFMNCSRKMEISAQENPIVTRELKRFAIIKNIPVILTHKLNRKIEKRENNRPNLKDIRDDGALEQDSDTVIYIYRDEYYKGVTEECSQAEIIIAKNRYDCVDTVFLKWQGRYGKFREGYKVNKNT